VENPVSYSAVTEIAVKMLCLHVRNCHSFSHDYWG